MVTTVDAFHSRVPRPALERGIDVMTEKPMVIDETQCRAVLDAEKRTGRKIVVTHNYRYAPKHQKIKELLMGGEIGKVTSVDFYWYLDTSHGADYFRRWHRLPVEERLALGAQGRRTTSTSSTGGSTPSRCRCRRSAASRTTGRGAPSATRTAGTCPHKDECSYYWDINRSKNLMALYNNCE